MWNDNYLHETTLNLLLIIHCALSNVCTVSTLHLDPREDDVLNWNWFEQVGNVHPIFMCVRDNQIWSGSWWPLDQYCKWRLFV